MVKGGAKTGLTRNIREFVRQNPGCYARDVATALKADGQVISKELCRMARMGTVVAELQPATRHNTFTVGREPYADAAESRQRAAIAREAKKAMERVAAGVPLRKPRAKRKRSPFMEPESTARGPSGQTVEEFLANGGRVEVLPVNWAPPTSYPRVSLNGAAHRRGSASV
jgi:hypothetical protein